MLIEIPFKTPTINHLYWHRGNIKIMKTEAKNLQKKIIQIVEPLKHLFSPSSGARLCVKVEIHEDWICKNGNIAKKDISNREKFLIDSVFKALEIDDCFIWEHSFKKVNSNIEKAVVSIEVI